MAIELVHDLFKHTGLDYLRAHRRFELAVFYDANSLDDFDLSDAIVIGLDALVYATSLPDSATSARLAKRVTKLLGPLTQPVMFRVQGQRKIWLPTKSH